MMTTTAPKPAFRFHPLMWGAAAAMLFVPAAAMLLTAEVNWGAEAFAAFGAMLALLCLALEAAWHWLAAPWWRLGGVIVAVLAFFIVWAELAVGLLD